MLGALALSGLVAVMTVPAATGWPVFEAFLQQVVIPRLQHSKPGATLVRDPLATHRLPHARALLESAGFALLPLPRYSPDLSPIELCWSKLKTPPRTAEPRSIVAIDEEIAPALDTITAQVPKAGSAIAVILSHTDPKIALIADSDDVGRAFRLMSATGSDRSRPAVPIDVGRGGGAPAGQV